jgi:hypothetical protein
VSTIRVRIPGRQQLGGQHEAGRPALTTNIVTLPEATELLHSNLPDVFSERNPEPSWAAIART